MTISEGLLLLPLGAVLTVLCLLGVRRLPSASRLQAASELSGLYVGAIAALYGVLLGFMVLAVWTRFDGAEARTEEEAATLGTVVRLAHALLPGHGGETVIVACHRYAESVEADEWPAMTRKQESTKTHRAMDDLWEAVLRLQTTSRDESSLVSEAITQMTELSRLRRLRLLDCRSGLPPLLWLVLTGGAVITVGSSLLLWTESRRLHALLAACLWLVVGGCLVAAGELSTPFSGDVHIESEVFARALRP